MLSHHWLGSWQSKCSILVYIGHEFWFDCKLNCIGTGTGPWYLVTGSTVSTVTETTLCTTTFTVNREQTLRTYTSRIFNKRARLKCILYLGRLHTTYNIHERKTKLALSCVITIVRFDVSKDRPLIPSVQMSHGFRNLNIRRFN